MKNVRCLHADTTKLVHIPFFVPVKLDQSIVTFQIPVPQMIELVVERHVVSIVAIALEHAPRVILSFGCYCLRCRSLRLIADENCYDQDGDQHNECQQPENIVDD